MGFELDSFSVLIIVLTVPAIGFVVAGFYRACSGNNYRSGCSAVAASLGPDLDFILTLFTP